MCFRLMLSLCLHYTWNNCYISIIEKKMEYVRNEYHNVKKGEKLITEFPQHRQGQSLFINLGAHFYLRTQLTSFLHLRMVLPPLCKEYYEVAFKPMTPTMINNTLMIRLLLFGSPKRNILSKTAPAVPIPIHTV